ncbi:MAG: hypothetical protein M1823_001877 [Watsoniomyces obsoletus]|nr:MAG: hypothetical protein M1823_001877 [Watsoniomyces obsoletus]
MSAVERVSNRSKSRTSNRSRSGTAPSQASLGSGLGPVEVRGPTRYFEPCAATASMFLCAQGASILCLHHDTLALERRFQGHTHPIVFIAVDNISERGAGRQVVSYDADQTAIVWDLMTGFEISRFASYDDITVAAWMRNGNVAFGNINGHVILFEPSTSEHISARTIFDPITSLAPSADCRTYAIGYQNGSILIAALQPAFTILHTLTTARAPSPILGLAWHGSSARQKSDMLATQTEDGDLRVWSIAKSPSSDPPRVVRVLNRSDHYEPAPNWFAWSKNGRIVQFSEGATSAWDVRTKNLTYEPVPTLDVVNGLAIYSASATLFTIGPHHTVQQFDLNPPTLVANRQHPPPLAPPSPPVSNESRRGKADMSVPVTAVPHVTRSLAPVQDDHATARELTASPLRRIAEEMDQIEEQRHQRSGAGSTNSSTSRSVGASSSRSSTSRQYPSRSNASAASRALASESTQFSHTSSLHGGAGRVSMSTKTSTVQSTGSQLSSSQASAGRGSRLRQEVLVSPDRPDKVIDLFPLARGRLSDVPYHNPLVSETANRTAADLRRQMLSVVFGWNDDIEPLIEAELQAHPPGSPGAILLSKWLNNVSPDMLESMAMSNTMGQADWMLLALSSMGGQSSTKKIGQAFVQKLLEKDDVHAAVTILLGLGEQNDAVEVYYSHRLFMEALVRKWGEHAVKHHQQPLAIRCFSCTGMDTANVMTSPRAYDTGTLDHAAPLLSPPLSPPGAKTARMTAKLSSLKLITSFDEKAPPPNAAKSRFFGMADGARTPMNAVGVTPIAESAISPGGPNLLRPGASNNRLPESARTATPGGFSRRRLPSIGETPIEATPRAALKPKALPTPADSGSEQERERRVEAVRQAESTSQPASTEPVLTLSSAKYVPGKGSQPPMPSLQTTNLPAPDRDPSTGLGRHVRDSTGSRDRKPDGLQIQWPPIEAIITGDYMSPGGATSASDRPRTNRSRTTSSVHSPSSVSNYGQTSPPLTASSAGLRSNGQPGKSMDRYISSLEEANYHAKRQRDESRRRQESRDRRRQHDMEDPVSRRGRSRDRSRQKMPEALEDRGMNGNRYIKPAKRSPSSPIPMSPEDLLNCRNDSYDDERFYATSTAGSTKRGKDGSRVRAGNSKTRDKSSGHRIVRVASTEPSVDIRIGGSGKTTSRGTSRRRRSPDGSLLAGRGRSQQRVDGARPTSPLSPSSMSSYRRRPSKQPNGDDEDGEELRAVEAERKRFRSRQRSTSRRPSERAGPASHRGESPERRRDPSTVRRTHKRSASFRVERAASPDERIRRARSGTREVTAEMGNLQRRPSGKSRRKELAAQELEERRQSLARRPSAPAIPHPAEILAARSPITARSADFPDNGMPRVSPPSHSGSRANPMDNSQSVAVGLPATPRAMRHPYYFGSEAKDEVPDMPAILPHMIGGHQQHNGAFAATAGLPPDRMDPTGGRLPPDVYADLHRRSMSAPISPPVLPAGLPTHPAFQPALPPSNRRRELSPNGEISRVPMSRKVLPGESQPGTLGYDGSDPAAAAAAAASRGQQTVMISIDERIRPSRFEENEEAVEVVDVPVSATASPAALPELRHLAQPPPPPPPPMGPPAPPSMVRSKHSHSSSVDRGAVAGVGVINIGIDGGSSSSRGGMMTAGGLEVPSRSQSAQPNQPTQSNSNNSNTNSNNNGRGRKEPHHDNTLSGKFSRATQRMRSASRGRNNNNKSPPMTGGLGGMTGADEAFYRTLAPYESVAPPPMPIPATAMPSLGMSAMEVPMRSHTTSPYLERHPAARGVPRGGGLADGGMI